MAGQPGNDALEERRARVDVRARGEPPVIRVPATVAGAHPPEFPGWIDPTTAPGAPSTRTHEIKLDQSHRILVASGSGDRQGVRGWLFPAALAGSIGLASIGMVGGYSVFTPHTASSMAPLQNPGPSPDIANSNKGDRLPVHRTVARETERAAPASAPHRPSPSASAAIARPKPSPPAASPPAPSADNHPPAAQPPAPSPTESAAKPRTEPHTDAPLAPVPETRPTTIDGWTLREVVDGTAVLEGPGGVWRAKRGDTVPGVGRIVGILRWGNRLIVATSKGLISSP